MDKKEFGERLKTALSNAGLLQAQAAEKLGIALPTLSKYINGHRVPDVHFIIQMAILTNCDIRWLLTGNVPDGHKMKDGSVTGNNDWATSSSWLSSLQILITKDPGLELIVEWLVSYSQAASPQEWELFKASFIRNYPRYASWIEKKEEELQITLVR